MSKILYREESYAVIGACFEVYNEMGSGFLEAVYQEAVEIEFSDKKIPFVAQKELELFYKNQKLKQKYIPDFICYDKIIVEIKAVSEVLDIHKAQLFNYLKATGLELGLLVNFSGFPKLEYERIVLSEKYARRNNILREL